MIKVEFLGPIGKAPIEMDAATLAEVSVKLKEDDTLTAWLDKCAVALNDTMVNDLSTALQDGDRVSILPPVCGGQRVELYNGPLDTKEIFGRWLDEQAESNYGAYIPFVGTIRAEDDIEALSFDIYEPVLQKWFDQWQEKAKALGAVVKMAHAIGDVPVHTSSYVSAVFSPKRRVALELIDEFVEDFKANAPIWKYDVKNGERIYAADRSTPMSGAGLLK